MRLACSSTVSDRELVRRAARGDGEAYGALVSRYYAPCARYAYRALGNREDVEDALQETFLRAYRALRRYEERGAFRAWVLRILVNECRTLASRRRRRERFQVWSDAALGAAEAPRAPEVDETADELQRALLRLPPPLREAFLLKYVEQLSYDEMAAVSGVGVSALKMRVKRACERLERELRGLAAAS